MSHAAWKTGLKWVWTILVLGFVVFYAYSRHDVILESLSLLSWTILLVALLTITAAKFTLVENMRLATTRAGLSFAYRDCYCMYNMSQLAKYVPGSIWQFVSRIAMLRDRGATSASIRDAMMAEHAWVLVTALLFGLVFVLASNPAWMTDTILQLWSEVTWLWLVLAGVVVIILAAPLHPVGRRLFHWGWSLRPCLRSTMVLLGTWLLLGTAFWITALPFSASPVPWLYCVGTYSLAYLIGFLVPFAPAGLGVREAVLVAAIASYVGVDAAVVLASVNRVLYLIGEIVVIFPCFKKY